MKQDIINHLKLVCNNTGYNFALAYAQLNQESRFDPFAISVAGAVGVAQFMPATWADISMKVIKYDPTGQKLLWDISKSELEITNYKDSIACYIYYMSLEIPKMLKYYGYSDTVENRLRTYNAGIGNLTKSKTFVETNNYVDIITNDPEIKKQSLAGILIGLTSLYFIS